MQGPLLVLIGLMFLIFFAQAFFGDSWYWELMAVPGSIVESWETLLAGQASGSDWREFGTLLSHAFLHGDIEHVTFNMLFFWIFGALIVELIGWRWMLLVFGLTAVAGGIGHVLLYRDSFIPMLGASGALMGFEGAYLGLATRWSLPNPHVWPMARPIAPAQLGLLAVVGVAIDFFSIMGGENDGIAYGAHVGGFMMGLLLGALVLPRPQGAGVARR